MYPLIEFEVMSMRKGRFAPTPSGLMHIGNMCAALLSWLDIRSSGGIYVLRMEDIDLARCRPEYAEKILDDLRWLGIDWDEGPDVGGPYAPYTQSERLSGYEEALQQLTRAGRVYPCYCSRAILQAIASAPHGLGSEGPVYPGTCRHLSEEERRRRMQLKTPAMRFMLSDSAHSWIDGVLGPQHIPVGYGGDFVIKRADGMFAYQLAVVVDDAAMGITHVMRGADLLDSTARQLELYEALGLAAPHYAHLPLLHLDGEKMSKRHAHGPTSIPEMRRAGVRAEALVGWIAYLYGLLDAPEPVKASELIAEYSISKLPRERIAVPSDMLQRLYAP